MSRDRVEPIKGRISVLDGYFGSDMEVVATEEGLEFESGSTLSWEWIDSARRSVQPSSAEFLPPDPATHTEDGECATE